LDGGSSPIHADIIRLEKDRQEINSNMFYNASGGGPQIIFDGNWEWQRGVGNPHYAECGVGQAANDIINGECFVNSGYWDGEDIIWTAMGVNAKNQMIWVIGRQAGVKSVFSQYGVTKAIKMDGGGSSQLVFADETIVRSSDFETKRKERVLASSLAVYYLYSDQVIDQPQWPILVEGESFDINITLKNIGSDTWTQTEYRLVNVLNPFGAHKELTLPKDVKPGESVTWSWKTDPIKDWRVYVSKWVMKKRDIEFPGEAVSFRVVVLPKELAEKKKELEEKIHDLIQEKVKDLEQAIMEEIKKRLVPTCPLSMVGLPLAVLAISRWQYRKKRSNTP
jgi:hypothetical protein